MYTYTTPTITCNLFGLDFSDVDYVRIKIKGAASSIVREFPITDIVIETTDTRTVGSASVDLTQEETVALGVGSVAIQARVHFSSGQVLATNIVTRQLNDVLDKVVI